MGGFPWTKEEDDILKKCILLYGEGNWHRLPLLSGLKRCRKSCRLRWLNYLRPNIRRGSFSQDEVQLILKLHKLLGNRWTTIAERLAGRTANDVKNYWNCHLSKKVLNSDDEGQAKQDTNEAAHPLTINEEQVESTIINDSAPMSCSVDDAIHESQNQEEVPTMEFEFEQAKPSNTNHWDWDDFLLDLDHI